MYIKQIYIYKIIFDEYLQYFVDIHLQDYFFCRYTSTRLKKKQIICIKKYCRYTSKIIL